MTPVEQGGLDPVSGKDACRGDRTVGHDHAEVLASRLFAQSGGDASEAKAFYHSGFQGEIHQGNASGGDLYVPGWQRRKP
jgi:hypothetical protein